MKILITIVSEKVNHLFGSSSIKSKDIIVPDDALLALPHPVDGQAVHHILHSLQEEPQGPNKYGDRARPGSDTGTITRITIKKYPKNNEKISVARIQECYVGDRFYN